MVCKYIEDPVLFSREEVGMVKFDIRYMLMLRSVRPLRLYAYDVFWLRFANRYNILTYIHINRDFCGNVLATLIITQYSG